MKKVLISAEKKQYKANLHSHSTMSDGALTPSELKDMYKSYGYDILAVTDHCHPYSHQELTEPDFLMLTGYEVYIRESGGPFDPFKPEVHLNLFARDPMNETLICPDSRYVKYIPEQRLAKMKKAGEPECREYSREYINRFIKTAVDNGYLVAYNHPFWSMESEADVLALENLHSLELRNTGSYNANRLECGEMLYDAMLRRGMRLGVHAGDDNHNRYPEGHIWFDSFGWYTVVLADGLTYADVFAAIERRDTYVSNGPAVKALYVEDGRVIVECSPAEAAYLYCGSKEPGAKRMPKGQTAERFEFKLDNRMKYIRVSVYDAEGRAANTRGFFRDEWE